MYSVGILSGKGKWAEVLSGILEASGSGVSGHADPRSSSPEEISRLIDYSDLVWIPEKTPNGMEEAIQVIRRSRHLSLGFPVAEFIDEAPCMVKLAHEAHVQVQVGHRDWYYPVLRSSLSHIAQPQSIHFTDFLPEYPQQEYHRQVFNIILADLDLALGLCTGTIRRVRANASRLSGGTAIHLDIRVELHSGCVISLAIRKFSNQPDRRMEIIQPDRIILIDLLNGTSSAEEFHDTGEGLVRQQRIIWPPDGTGQNSLGSGSPEETELARQCLSFIHALQSGRHPLSSLEGGFKALEVTRQVESMLGTF